MLRSLRYPVALVIVALAFIGGAATANLRMWFDPVVAITIANDSGQPITAMRVEVQAGTSTHLALLDSLPAGEKHVMYFHTPGQARLTVEARLQDGQTVRSSENYLEPGVILTSHIEPARVRGEYIGRM